MRFFVGLHQPSDARHFDSAFISVNRLRGRKRPFHVSDWIMDSGAFTEVAIHGGYRHTVDDYASEIRRWRDNGTMLAAVAQDWMCEPFVLRKTGKTVPEHQRMTVERYDDLINADPCAYIMPVLQGYEPSDYCRHIEMYDDRLAEAQWVGVGSVCKRNGTPESVVRVLAAIKDERPDLLLHGFGLKLTALSWSPIVARLYSADSMAWSFAARVNGRNGNDWREAEAYRAEVARRQGEKSCGWQSTLPL